jgi:hypothetical protein
MIVDSVDIYFSYSTTSLAISVSLLIMINHSDEYLVHLDAQHLLTCFVALHPSQSSIVVVLLVNITMYSNHQTTTAHYIRNDDL